MYPTKRPRRQGRRRRRCSKPTREAGRIVLDSETTLAGMPPEAWDYQLGNRSALEWILDQYKEKKPKDPTIREKFDTYRFADYKEKVIDLLARVTTVSVETQRIVEEMKKAQGAEGVLHRHSATEAPMTRTDFDCNPRARRRRLRRALPGSRCGEPGRYRRGSDEQFARSRVELFFESASLEEIKRRVKGEVYVTRLEVAAALDSRCFPGRGQRPCSRFTDSPRFANAQPLCDAEEIRGGDDHGAGPDASRDSHWHLAVDHPSSKSRARSFSTRRGRLLRRVMRWLCAQPNSEAAQYGSNSESLNALRLSRNRLCRI